MNLLPRLPGRTSGLLAAALVLAGVSGCASERNAKTVEAASLAAALESDGSVELTFTRYEQGAWDWFATRPKRGHLVAFDPSRAHPDVVGEVAPGDLWVLRVWGLPGENIDLDEDGRVLLNGEAMEWVPGGPEGARFSADGGIEFPLTIPKKQYFLLADEPEGATDSRAFGTIERSRIIGHITGAAD